VIIDEAHSSQGGDAATDLKEVLGGEELRREARKRAAVSAASTTNSDRPLTRSDFDDHPELARIACTGRTPPRRRRFRQSPLGSRIEGDLPPVYHFPEPAARALSMLHRYAKWRRRPLDVEPPRFEVDDGEVARILEAAGEGYLPPGDAFRVLDLYGIPTARVRIAKTRAEAVAAAEDVGFPTVLKSIVPGVVHKSESGGVILGLETPDEVGRAVDAMVERLEASGAALEGFLVQEWARNGHEVVFGISVDPRFGPLLMFGLGGIYVEVFQDVRFGVTPLTPHEADEMIGGIRAWKLLAGTRGERPADRDVLREVLLRLAQLALRHPSIRELDINPFLAAPERPGAKAVDVRIRVG
jgi:acyl-CoA synthetase (NDP forming)